MAFTIQSYLMADPSAIVLPTSKVHHAHRSPRRKAVTAIAIAINPNTSPLVLAQIMEQAAHA